MSPCLPRRPSAPAAASGAGGTPATRGYRASPLTRQLPVWESWLAIQQPSAFRDGSSAPLAPRKGTSKRGVGETARCGGSCGLPSFWGGRVFNALRSCGCYLS